MASRPLAPMDTVRVGVVGCGWFGRAHARVYRTLPGVELVAVADVNRELAESVASWYGVKCYASVREMLEKEELDAVSVVVTPQRLAEVTREVISSGTHALVEKPVATSLEDLSDLIRLAESKRVIVMPGFIELFNPGYRILKDLIRDGRLGDIYVISGKRIGRSPKRDVKWEIGVSLDLAVHEVYVQLDLLSEEPSSVWAFNRSVLGQGVEDVSVYIMEYPSGVVGVIEANWLTPISYRAVRVSGSAASAELDYLNQKVTLDELGRSTVIRARWSEPLAEELSYFVRHVKEGREPDLDLKAAEKVLSVLLAGR